MANIKFGPIVSDVRGSVAGLCFSRGAGGAIIRNAPKPCNPRSALQSMQRAILSTLSGKWARSLTQDQRDGWGEYAAGTSWKNKVGTTANITGLAAYLRTNSLRMLCGLVSYPDPPESPGHTEEGIFTFTADEVDQTIEVSQPGGGFSPGVDDWLAIFFMYRPRGAGAVATPSHARYADLSVGVGGAGDSFPLSIDSPWFFSNGNLITLGCTLMSPDGKLSSRYLAHATAATP